MKRRIIIAIYFLGFVSLFISSSPSISLFAGAPLVRAESREKEMQGAIKVVKKMIVAMRLDADEKALTYIGLKEMSRYLLGQYYAKMKPEQQKEFQILLAAYIKKKAFPRARKYIGSVGLSYDRPVFKNDRIFIKSSIVYRGSERLVFTWVLKSRDETYVLTDFLNVNGVSSMKRSRDKQILPVYRARGVLGLLKLLKKAVK